MNPDRFAEIERVCQAVLDRPPDERQAFLDEACQGDGELRAELDALLAGTSGPSSVLGSQAFVMSRPGLKEGQRVGPYEVESAIGAGGMGEVYRARDTRLGRSVAIKVLPPVLGLDPDRRARFHREAKAVASLSHPHICALYDVGSENGVDFLVMEHLEGETLEARLEKHRGATGGGGLAPADATRYAIEIADALAAAHRRAIVHRDIKPANIFITREGVKLLDFGLAKLTDVSARFDRLGTNGATAPGTIEGVLLGTAPYMAPEQVEGKDTDARSDIFAFGAVLYEMLSGKRAFPGSSPTSVMAAILGRAPDPLSEVQPPIPQALDRMVRECLEKDPEDRWQSARDIKRELEWIRDRGEPAALPGSGRPEEAGKRRAVLSRRPMAWLAAGALLAVFLAAGLVFSRSIAAPPQPRWHQLTFRRGTIGSARFMPDAQNVLYTAAWEGRPAAAFTVRVDASDSLPLPAWQIDDPHFASDVAAISGSRELALIARPSTSVDPINSAEGMLATVSYGGVRAAPRRQGVTSADWTASSQLAITTGASTLEFPLGRVIYSAPDWMVSDVRVSPRADLLAFRKHRNGHGWIVMVDATGRQKAQSSWYDDVGPPAWTPDGREVWFMAPDHGARHALRAMSVSGGQRTVTRLPVRFLLHDIASDGRVLLATENTTVAIRGRPPGERAERDLSWHSWSIADDISDDGRVLLFDEGGESDGIDRKQCLRGTDGSPAVALGRGWFGRLSPDGKLVVATSCCDEDANQSFFLMTTEPVTERRLPVPGLAASVRGIGNALLGWLPDSSGFVFVAHAPGRPDRAWLYRLDGSPTVALTAEGESARLLGPDGRSVIVERKDGFVLSQSPVGLATPLRGLEGEEWALLGWHSDRRALRVAKMPTKVLPAPVFLLDPFTGRQQAWKEVGTPLDPVGLTSINGIRFSRDGEAYAYTYSRRLSTLHVVGGLR